MKFATLSRLPVFIQPYPDELPVSILWGLAKANGFLSSAEFCRYSGINAFHLAQGREYQVERLAVLSAVSPDILSRFAVPKLTYVQYGAGATVKREQLQAKGVRFCRACLQDDIDATSACPTARPYFRASWRWSLISHCPKHHTALEARSESLTSLGDISKWLADLPASPSQPHEQADILVSLSAYLTSRLNGSSGNQFIDTIPLRGVIELCALLAHFHHVAAGGPVSPHVRRKMYNASNIAIGFKIASRGREAICDFLTRYVQKTIDRVQHWDTVYTAVLWWLRPNLHNPDFASLVELFQTHAESYLPYDAGDVFLKEVQKRKVHTIATAAAEHELTVERVKKVIKERWPEIERQGFISRRLQSRYRS